MVARVAEPVKVIVDPEAMVAVTLAKKCLVCTVPER